MGAEWWRLDTNSWGFLVNGTVRDVCVSLLGAAAAGSLILGLTRLIHPLGPQELMAIWVVGVAMVCAYPLLMRSEPDRILPPGTMLVGTLGLLIFSNSPTDALLVPSCLILALIALRTLPDLAAMKAPLSLALAGATIDLTGGIFWLTGDPALKEISWYAAALGGGLVFAGLGLAAARAPTRGYGLANAGLALSALGVAGGWMAEAIWELIARVFVPFRDIYVLSAFPTDPRIPYLTGGAYVLAAIGFLVLLRAAKPPRQERFATIEGGKGSEAMHELRAEWSDELPRRAVGGTRNSFAGSTAPPRRGR